VLRSEKTKEVALKLNTLDLTTDKQIRLLDRWRIYQLRQSHSLLKKFLLFLALVGPGILVMIADNDARRSYYLRSNWGAVRYRIFYTLSYLNDTRCLYCARNDSEAWSCYKARACRNDMEKVWKILGSIFST